MPSIYKSRDTRSTKGNREALNADLKSKGISNEVEEMIKSIGDRERYLISLRKTYKINPEQTMKFFHANKAVMDDLNIKPEDFIEAEKVLK